MSKIQELRITSINQVHQLGVETGTYKSTFDEGVLMIRTANRKWYLYKTETVHNLGDGEEHMNVMFSVYMVSKVHPLCSAFNEDDHETGYAFTAVAAVKHLLMEDLDEYLNTEITKIIPARVQEAESEGLDQLIHGLMEEVSRQALEIDDEAAVTVLH